MEQWNNVELSDLSKKSYTLNHKYDGPAKCVAIDTSDSTKVIAANSEPTEPAKENANGSELLQPGSTIKPKITTEDVETLARRLYGITTSEIKELISYDDRNFYIQEDSNIKNPLINPHCPHGYVLKILNALDSKKTDCVDAQNEMMIYLSKLGVQCTTPIANVFGKHFSVEHLNGGEHVVRLLKYIPGKIFHQVETTNHLLYQSGEYIAKMDRALKNFTHSAYDTHKTLWMLQSLPQLRDFFYVIKDHGRKAMIESIVAAFEKNVLSRLDTFETQIIYGDYNEQNIIVEPATSSTHPSSSYRVAGIIDFGDTNKSPLIFEVGIALSYMMVQAKNLESGGIFLAGYTSVQPLSSDERSVLKYCVAARLAQSLVMGLYTHSVDPKNEYVLVTQAQGWQLMEELYRDHFETVDELWQTTADMYLTQSVK